MCSKIKTFFAKLLLSPNYKRPIPERYGDLDKVKSDGCTCAPEFNFRECCVMHDLDYQRGGSEWQRVIDDTMFFWRIWMTYKKTRRFIWAVSFPLYFFLGGVYSTAVRIAPLIPPWSKKPDYYNWTKD